MTDSLLINKKIFTAERALRKKYLCARFTPRNDALDAITDIIVLARAKRPPKGYTDAGDVDGMKICFKVNTIPETYGRLRNELKHSQSNPGSLYPSVPTKILNEEYRHSTPTMDPAPSDYNRFTIKPRHGTIKGIDGVPFKLRADLKTASTGNAKDKLPDLLDPKLDFFVYNFATERQCV